MADELIKVNKYTGVYYRELKTRFQGKPDRTFYIKYLDNLGKQRSKRVGRFSLGITAEYANRELIEIKAKQNNSPKYVNREVLFKDLCEAYLDSIKHKSSYKQYHRQFNKVIYTFFDEKVTAESIHSLEGYLAYLREQYSSPKTIREYLLKVKTVFNYAVKMKLYHGDIPNVIFDDKINNQRDRYLEVDEIEILLERAKDDHVFFRFILLSLNTGVRATACLQLRFADVDFRRKTIKLYDNKSDEHYYNYLNDDIFNYLLKIKKENKITNANTFISNLSTKEYSYKTLYNRCQPILDELFNQGLASDDRKNRVVFHTFRHSYASHLALSGAPILHIKELMNHSSLNMTMRYAHLSPSSLADSAKKLKITDIT